MLKVHDLHITYMILLHIDISIRFLFIFASHHTPNNKSFTPIWNQVGKWQSNGQLVGCMSKSSKEQTRTLAPRDVQNAATHKIYIGRRRCIAHPMPHTPHTVHLHSPHLQPRHSLILTSPIILQFTAPSWKL